MYQKTGQFSYETHFGEAKMSNLDNFNVDTHILQFNFSVDFCCCHPKMSFKAVASKTFMTNLLPFPKTCQYGVQKVTNILVVGVPHIKSKLVPF
jgi:hypothetical protein